MNKNNTMQELKLNTTYFAVTRTGTLRVMLNNQDSLYAYCTILEGNNVGEEISLRKEHTEFKKSSKK